MIINRNSRPELFCKKVFLIKLQAFVLEEHLFLLNTSDGCFCINIRHCLIQIRVFFKKIKSTLLKSIYFYFKTTIKQMFILLSNETGEKSNWQKSSAMSGSDFKKGCRKKLEPVLVKIHQLKTL